MQAIESTDDQVAREASAISKILQILGIILLLLETMKTGLEQYEKMKEL